jgi:hypothetical protein
MSTSNGSFEPVMEAPKKSSVTWVKSKEYYSRESVLNDPNTLYIFTDNTDRTSGG